jgi:hypothetical protein
MPYTSDQIKSEIVLCSKSEIFFTTQWGTKKCLSNFMKYRRLSRLGQRFTVNRKNRGDMFLAMSQFIEDKFQAANAKAKRWPRRM